MIRGGIAVMIQDETGTGTAPNTARLRGSKEDFLQLNQGFRAPGTIFFIHK